MTMPLKTSGNISQLKMQLVEYALNHAGPLPLPLLIKQGLN